MIAQELATLAGAQRMSPALVMRDPYILDFLGLQDSWQEGDLEGAIIREMESFLLELGAGFSFLARQKRIQIDDEDFHLDLLFYNRAEAIGRRRAEDRRLRGSAQGPDGAVSALAGQARTRTRRGRATGDHPVHGQKREQIELLELDRSGYTSPNT